MKTTTEALRHREEKGGKITNDTNQRIARIIRDYDEAAWKVSLLVYEPIDLWTRSPISEKVIEDDDDDGL